MAEASEPRVAVYIDFDNIVISRYNQIHKGGRNPRKVKDLDPREPDTATRLREARVDIGALLDFASSFGTVAVSRAYADWSVPVNSDYNDQLIERAVDLVQLFPTVQSGKNGADIRLALDVAEDLYRLEHITHVVIVAGDSDYIAVAQMCKKLGRYVVGIGVEGSTSPSLKFACDEFKDYDALPGVVPVAVTSAIPAEKHSRSSSPKTAKSGPADLLVRALELVQAKNDGEWQSNAAIKNQILRLDPSFQEGKLGFKSFTEFVQSLPELVELDGGTTNRKMRLRTAPASEQG